MKCNNPIVADKSVYLSCVLISNPVWTQKGQISVSHTLSLCVEPTMWCWQQLGQNEHQHILDGCQGYCPFSSNALHFRLKRPKICGICLNVGNSVDVKKKYVKSTIDISQTSPAAQSSSLLLNCIFRMSLTTYMNTPLHVMLLLKLCLK